MRAVEAALREKGIQSGKAFSARRVFHIHRIEQCCGRFRGKLYTMPRFGEVILPELAIVVKVGPAYLAAENARGIRPKTSEKFPRSRAAESRPLRRIGDFLGIGHPERQRRRDYDAASRALMSDAARKTGGGLQSLCIPQTEEILHVEQGRLRSMSRLQHAHGGVSPCGLPVTLYRFHVPTLSFYRFAVQLPTSLALPYY